MAGRRVLLVEGKDDQHVMWALLQAHGVPNVFSVEKPGDDDAALNAGTADESGGVTKLLDSIPVWLKASALERLAIVIDADSNLSQRWGRLCERLRSEQFDEFPDEPSPSGTIIRSIGRPTIGIWLMPDNQLPGILEHFLAFLIPVGDSMLPLVDELINKIPVEQRRFPAQRHAKARIHTWLSLQKEPGKPLGQSITARYLDASAQIVEPFLNWLRAVLVD